MFYCKPLISCCSAPLLNSCQQLWQVIKTIHKDMTKESVQESELSDNSICDIFDKEHHFVILHDVPHHWRGRAVNPLQKKNFIFRKTSGKHSTYSTTTKLLQSGIAASTK